MAFRLKVPLLNIPCFVQSYFLYTQLLFCALLRHFDAIFALSAPCQFTPLNFVFFFRLNALWQAALD